MNINQLQNLLRDLGTTRFLYKLLSENDNSKNQVYLGSSYEVLQEIPHGELETYSDCSLPNYKAKLDFWWITEHGELCNAPNAQLILYPKYPEVRLSGFIKGCSKAPSEHFRVIDREKRTGKKDGRVLIFSPIGTRLYAYLAPKDSSISNYLLQLENDELFGIIEFEKKGSRTELIEHLKEEYKKNPHELVKMNSQGIIEPYSAKNAAGYTLEASFGIIPNGNPEPDFKGWELKCYSSSSITLMTPEPDGGLYKELGTRDFVKTYGHVAENGSKYFTGPYRVENNDNFGVNRHLIVQGFDINSQKITDVDGSIVLLQDDSLELASWSFSHILGHWGKKHNRTCYVRYSKALSHLIDYDHIIFLGEGTSPIFFLKAIVENAVYYDPGSRINLEGKLKARSQFRIKPKDLYSMYKKLEKIDLLEK